MNNEIFKFFYKLKEISQQFFSEAKNLYYILNHIKNFLFYWHRITNILLQLLNNLRLSRMIFRILLILMTNLGGDLYPAVGPKKG